MSKKLPIVAIIGQTNAGKSALFNRIVGRQDAIVAREAGTTRDNIVRTVGGKFILVDTAGLKDPEDDFEATIQDQISDAVDTADLILLVKDRTEYVTDEDRRIAKTALKSKKPVILILNKSDLKEKLPKDEFLRLGVKDIAEISAEHNRGISDLVAKIEKTALEISGKKPGDKPRSEDETSLKIALIGRPNVGKSNLFNTLAGKQQAIVASVAGTTRDINRTSIKYHGQTIELLDTAGVRRKGKIERGVEKFSILRTVSAIEESDICLLLMDVNELNTGVDLSLAGMITEAGKGIIVVVTKWDLAANNKPEIVDENEEETKEFDNHKKTPTYQSERQFSDDVLAQIGYEFNFVHTHQWYLLVVLQGRM
jgi:ribosome-associated GTPase EngA